jgi:hypothetical protein
MVFCSSSKDVVASFIKRKYISKQWVAATHTDDVKIPPSPPSADPAGYNLSGSVSIKPADWWSNSIVEQASGAVLYAEKPPLPHDSETKASSASPATPASSSVLLPADICMRVLQEIVSSEENYVAGLNFLLRSFFKPFLKLVVVGNSKAAALTPAAQREEASNPLAVAAAQLEIFEFLHGHILEAFVAADPPSSMHVAQVMLKHADFLKMYTTYLNLYPALLSFCAHDKAWATFLTGRTKVPGELSPDSYLILPVQRPPRYGILLKEVLKRAREAAESKSTLTLVEQACYRVHNVLGFLNDSAQRAENVGRLAALRANISGVGAVAELKTTFFQADRWLRKEGEVEIFKITNQVGVAGIHPRVCVQGRPAGRWKTRRLFLFSDMLLWTDSQTLEYKGFISLVNASCSRSQALAPFEPSVSSVSSSLAELRIILTIRSGLTPVSPGNPPNSYGHIIDLGFPGNSGGGESPGVEWERLITEATNSQAQALEKRRDSYLRSALPRAQSVSAGESSLSQPPNQLVQESLPGGVGDASVLCTSRISTSSMLQGATRAVLPARIASDPRISPAASLPDHSFALAPDSNGNMSSAPGRLPSAPAAGCERVSGVEVEADFLQLSHGFGHSVFYPDANLSLPTVAAASVGSDSAIQTGSDSQGDAPPSYAQSHHRSQRHGISSPPSDADSTLPPTPAQLQRALHASLLDMGFSDPVAMQAATHFAGAYGDAGAGDGRRPPTLQSAIATWLPKAVGLCLHRLGRESAKPEALEAMSTLPGFSRVVDLSDWGFMGTEKDDKSAGNADRTEPGCSNNSSALCPPLLYVPLPKVSDEGDLGARLASGISATWSGVSRDAPTPHGPNASLAPPIASSLPVDFSLLFSRQVSDPSASTATNVVKAGGGQAQAKPALPRVQAPVATSALPTPSPTPTPPIPGVRRPSGTGSSGSSSTRASEVREVKGNLRLEVQAAAAGAGEALDLPASTLGATGFALESDGRAKQTRTGLAVPRPLLSKAHFDTLGRLLGDLALDLLLSIANLVPCDPRLPGKPLLSTSASASLSTPPRSSAAARAPLLLARELLGDGGVGGRYLDPNKPLAGSAGLNVNVLVIVPDLKNHSSPALLARSVSVYDGLQQGSVLPLVLQARARGFIVALLNPSGLLPSPGPFALQAELEQRQAEVLAEGASVLRWLLTTRLPAFRTAFVTIGAGAALLERALASLSVRTSGSPNAVPPRPDSDPALSTGSDSTGFRSLAIAVLFDPCAPLGCGGSEGSNKAWFSKPGADKVYKGILHSRLFVLFRVTR